jgi:hypothetical protein
MSWVQKMRQKTDIEKKAFSFLWATVFTLGIFFVWLFGTFYSLKNIDNNSQIATPVESVTNYIKGLFDGKSVYRAD